MDDLVKFEGVRKSYGKLSALINTEFSIPSGSVTTLLGPNGAGKTTALKMMVNLIKPTRGTVTVLGKDSRKLGVSELQKVGYVAEGMDLPDWMCVAQYMNWCRPLYPKWDRKLERKLGHLFQLPLERRLQDLSRGQRMKAALWSVLSYRPELLILDEPFSGLDPVVRDDLTRSVLELADREKWAVVISTHDIAEVENLADRLVVLKYGKVALEGDCEELLARWRKVELLLPEGWSRPERYPREWLEIRQSGRVLHFLESEFNESLPEKLKTYFGESTEPQLQQISLREMLVALVKAGHVEVGR